jgi:hypothetical protein
VRREHPHEHSPPDRARRTPPAQIAGNRVADINRQRQSVVPPPFAIDQDLAGSSIWPIRFVSPRAPALRIAENHAAPLDRLVAVTTETVTERNPARLPWRTPEHRPAGRSFPVW